MTSLHSARPAAPPASSPLPRPRRHGLSLVDATNLALLSVLATVAVVLLRDGAVWSKLLALWLPAVVLSAIAVRARCRPGRVGSARAWFLFGYPIAVLFLLFESLFFLIPAVNPRSFDPELVAIDRWLLGGDATLLIERWNHPWLDELFFLCYFLYFPMPMVTLVSLFLRRRHREVEHSFFVYLLCYYVSYLIYLVVPAGGPKRYLTGQHQTSIDGVLLARPIRLLVDSLEPSGIDAFPSVHCAILITTMLVCHWYNRRVFWAFVPLAFGILWSLVYTRNHYVIDVIAGALVAFGTAALANRWFPRLQHRFAPQLGAPSSPAEGP